MVIGVLSFGISGRHFECYREEACRSRLRSMMDIAMNRFDIDATWKIGDAATAVSISTVAML